MVLLLFCVVALAVDPPTLAETEQFVIKYANGTKKSQTNQWMAVETVTAQVRRISCAAIVHEKQTSYSTGRNYLRQREWKPSQVDYSENGEFVVVRCASGNCIRQNCVTRNCTDDNDEYVDHVWVRVSVSGDRMARALQHHRDLCGGSEKTPF
jgi:hypothetical protein